MEIVIKIPDKKYESLKILKAMGMEMGLLEKAVLNGTPLPKGHGRIGDLDKLEKVLDDYVLNEKGCPMHIASEVCYNIDCFEAIIEADKEG